MPGQDLTDEANAIIAKLEAKAADLKAKRLANPPRPFRLHEPGETTRLFREVLGYLTVSLHHGTDTEGRLHALEAIRTLYTDSTLLDVQERSAAERASVEAQSL